MEECISMEIERNNRGKSGLKCGAYDIDTFRVISYSLIKQIVKKKKGQRRPFYKEGASLTNIYNKYETIKEKYTTYVFHGQYKLGFPDVHFRQGRLVS